ncbi:MAG: Txe/YoeB family addiction module toxin [Mailhella sp.]|nr:Txe/YoeB family addiction module toxin [Mailhella sp.]
MHWQGQDKKTLKRINALLKEMMHTPYEGTGKPEPLRGNLFGWWSRRIDVVNRIVYKKYKDSIIIAACKGNYDEQ